MRVFAEPARPCHVISFGVMSELSARRKRTNSISQFVREIVRRESSNPTECREMSQVERREFLTVYFGTLLTRRSGFNWFVNSSGILLGTSFISFVTQVNFASSTFGVSRPTFLSPFHQMQKSS